MVLPKQSYRSLRIFRKNDNDFHALLKPSDQANLVLMIRTDTRSCTSLAALALLVKLLNHAAKMPLHDAANWH